MSAGHFSVSVRLIVRYHNNIRHRFSWPKDHIFPLCWPHLIRKLKALKDGRSSPHTYCFARNMLKEAGTIFTIWHAFKE